MVVDAEQLVVADANEPTTLKIDAMSNSYRTFVLIWQRRRELFKRRRALTNAA